MTEQQLYLVMSYTVLFIILLLIPSFRKFQFFRGNITFAVGVVVAIYSIVIPWKAMDPGAWREMEMRSLFTSHIHYALAVLASVLTFVGGVYYAVKGWRDK